ncbi:MAG: EAL domain-containing protein [Gammaproteobacteria bacterium]|nr:EAL domain-containing protein [Gammaproteobacteria bacterium]
MPLGVQLRKAPERDELRLNYQPQIELKRNALVGMEALVRWNNDDLGFVSPGEFIPIAEETGLIRPMTDWITRAACQYTRQCHSEGLSDIVVSVNLSAADFKDSSLAKNLSDIVDSTGLAPQFVKIELTESTLFSNIDSAIQTLNELNERGFKIAVDDFGTGYSSLNYLSQCLMLRPNSKPVSVEFSQSRERCHEGLPCFSDTR